MAGLLNSVALGRWRFPWVTRGSDPVTSRMEDGNAAGVCAVCGEPACFTGFSDNQRESGHCSVCGAFNRQRQLAWALRAALGLPRDGPLKLFHGTTLYNLESTGPLHRQLQHARGYVCSEYFGPEFQPGQKVGDIRHEDLQRLSFDDRRFDVVLSSDVLEHVPDPYGAHQEIWRVLKPGGFHLFTVPFDEDAENDQVRARLVDGVIQHLEEPIFHGDPVRPAEGILVWTIFGRTMMDRLAMIGFEVVEQRLLMPSCGIVGRNAIVFMARKPERRRSPS